MKKTRKVTPDLTRMVETFCQLATIRSPGLAVGAIMGWLDAIIRKQFGLQPSFDEVGKGMPGYECGNMKFVVPATPGCESLPMIGLDAHVDTVAVPPGRQIRPVTSDDTITSDGTTILGADDKCGVTAILEALWLLQESGIPHGPIQVVFSVGEELSMYGWRGIDRSQIKADRFICLEAGSLAQLAIGCAGKIKWRAIFTGQASHAHDPEKGLNAILVAAYTINMARAGDAFGYDPKHRDSYGVIRSKSGDPDGDVFVNLSGISGGDPFPATNVVPASVEICGEFRGHNHERMEQGLEHLIDVVNQSVWRLKSVDGTCQAKVEWQTETPYQPCFLPPDHELTRHVLQAMKQAKVKDAKPQRIYGATHANVINALDIPAVVLHAGGHKPHSVDEYLVIDEMVGAACVLVEALKAK